MIINEPDPLSQQTLDPNGDQLTGLGELLDATAQTSPASTRQELREAARGFERATRHHLGAQRGDQQALRSAARGIILAGNALGRGEDGGATAMLLSTLVLATMAAARWHSARGHAQQVAAAHQAATHLRAAYQTAAGTPMRAMREHARHLPGPTRQRHTTTLEAVLPSHSAQMNTEDGWDALTATLDQAERAGHDPATLLREATAQRELLTADNINHVLTWRLRRLADLPADPGTLTGKAMNPQPQHTVAPQRPPGQPRRGPNRK
ncbi:hypothetical protein [Streptomyces carpaticus]|uniref:Mobilization protein n=1 Tax=Streptomyces carpaticus TaxID=285558 RepID=A0ABV4ZH94_9ACTN